MIYTLQEHYLQPPRNRSSSYNNVCKYGTLRCLEKSEADVLCNENAHLINGNFKFSFPNIQYAPFSYNYYKQLYK